MRLIFYYKGENPLFGPLGTCRYFDFCKTIAVITAGSLLFSAIAPVYAEASIRNERQKQADELEVSHRVKFLGFIPYADMPKYLSVCDIFIRPSRSEGFGNSFIEAMAARLPVIATPVGGIPDFIHDGETGVFASPDNPQSIVKAVELILGDVTLRSTMVENAYAMVLEKYSWDTVAGEMRGAFGRLSE